MSEAAAGLDRQVAAVLSRMEAAARRAGRDPSEVQIVAVSKTHGPERIRAAYAAGLRHFGENRVEEARPKIALLRAALPEATWHMIGHIQGRKAADVAELFDVVHSVARVKVARTLANSAQRERKVIPVLLEVNVSGEESKDGFDLAHWPEDTAAWDAFCRDVEVVLALPGLRVDGLMMMAPWVEDPEVVRPIFRRTRDLRARLREQFPQLRWNTLSMGMSGDYEVAIEEGATMVRIGTAIFGPREVPPQSGPD